MEEEAESRPRRTRERTGAGSHGKPQHLRQQYRRNVLNTIYTFINTYLSMYACIYIYSIYLSIRIYLSVSVYVMYIYIVRPRRTRERTGGGSHGNPQHLETKMNIKYINIYTLEPRKATTPKPRTYLYIHECIPTFIYLSISDIYDRGADGGGGGK